MSKYGVISGPYFLVFGMNTGKYGPEITPHLDIFHAVSDTQDKLLVSKMRRKNANLLSFLHTELLEKNIIGVS